MNAIFELVCHDLQPTTSRSGWTGVWLENHEGEHRLTRLWCAGFSGCQAMMTVVAHYCNKLKLPLPAINAEALLQVYCADLEIPMVSHLWLLPCTRCDFQGLHRLLLDVFLYFDGSLFGRILLIWQKRNANDLTLHHLQNPCRSQWCVPESCWGAGIGQTVWQVMRVFIIVCKKSIRRKTWPRDVIHLKLVHGNQR